MNKTAYTLFVAFVASLLTLAAVQVLTPQRAEAGAVREITLDELAAHDHRDSCWKAINGRVYDITDYIPNHPTSERVLTRWCGQESTEAWDAIAGGRGHSTSAEAMLARYRIGVLAGSGLTADDLASPESAAAPALPILASADQARGGYQDGVFYAESAPNERGYLAMIEIWVRGGFITQVHYDEIARDESGQVTQRKLYDYNYAQRWRNAMPNGISQLTAFPAYGRQLVATGDPDQVDALSGATSSHEWFQDVAREALSNAQ
jgi:major membrane immunogen (membrane-anchored lipoprotein)/predicted heme/steroid binding protein